MGIEGMQWLKDQKIKPERLEKVRALDKFAKELGTTLPKLAIAWTVQNPDVSTAILGASRVEQLEETLTALDVLPLLTPEVNQKIEDILGNLPERPQY
jgi:aryl-alcohol dehydrogenase-like predicted oxidoreductase